MEVSSGYKQTEVGVIPEDWVVALLGSCLSCSPDYGINAPAVPYSDKLPTYIRITDITEDGYFKSDKPVSVKSVAAGNYFLSDGDIVFARTGASVGKSYRYNLSDGPLVFAGFLIRASPDITKLLPAFAAAYFTTGNYWRWVRLMSMRSGQPGINGKEYSQLPIPKPPIPEQRVIAEALSDVDALLEGLKRLVTKKRNIKQAAMQQLLTGKTRLPGFSGEWEVKRLGELLDYEQPTEYLVSSSEYSDANDVPVLTAGKTFILGYTNEADGIFNNLPVIIFDDFTTATKYVTFSFKAKSSAMKLLKPHKPSVNLRFVYEIMQLIDFRLSEHKRYWISEFQKLQVKIPDEKEQTAIMNVLSDMDSELTALEKRRDKTRNIKQAMMQELLTGKTRLI
jgi:type I restriction enzyme, S subunit